MKKNILIVILAVIVLITGGYIVYDKIYVESDSISTNESNSSNEIEMMDISNKSELQVLNSLLGYRIIVSKDGNVYMILNDEIEHSSDISNLKNQIKEYVVDGVCNVDLEEVCSSDNKINAIKLDISDVVSAYEIHQGLSADSFNLYFIKSDGTVSKLAIGLELYDASRTATLSIENNYMNLKNIITIVQSATIGYASNTYQGIAIEKNGTQHIL